MNPEFKGKFVQNVGYIVSKGVNGIKAGFELISGKTNSFRQSYELRMREEERHPTRLAVKGWAAIIATVMVSSLIVNSFK